jgi:hypothetical protein
LEEEILRPDFQGPLILHEGSHFLADFRDVQVKDSLAQKIQQPCSRERPIVHPATLLLTAIYVAEEVCEPVAYRQVVLTIPKRLRLHTRFDRRLPGKLSR